MVGEASAGTGDDDSRPVDPPRVLAHVIERIRVDRERGGHCHR